MQDWTLQVKACRSINEASKPYRSGFRTRQRGFFAPALWREGGEYNTLQGNLRGNKPAYLLLGFDPPAASGSSKALCRWLFNSQQKGFDMTNNFTGRNLSDSQINDFNLYLAFLKREADFVRSIMGYADDFGYLTPVRSQVNRLYPYDLSDCIAVLHGRAQIILEQLEIYRD